MSRIVKNSPAIKRSKLAIYLAKGCLTTYTILRYTHVRRLYREITIWKKNQGKVILASLFELLRVASTNPTMTTILGILLTLANFPLQHLILRWFLVIFPRLEYHKLLESGRCFDNNI
jgi:hypothetical protein